MPTYRVTHEDGRTTDVISPDETLVKKQANHQETTRVLIAQRKGVPHGPDPSMAIHYSKIKE